MRVVFFRICSFPGNRYERPFADVAQTIDYIYIINFGMACCCSYNSAEKIMNSSKKNLREPKSKRKKILDTLFVDFMKKRHLTWLSTNV